jgi:hypothetical protein
MARARQKPDLRANFEAILGETLDDDAGVAPVFVRAAVGTGEDLQYLAPQNRMITSRDIGTSGDSSKTCARHPINEVTGTARTGDDGTIQFLLSDFYCRPRNVTPFIQPLNFVATPLSSSPRYLTCTAILCSDDIDVQVTVRAWDQAGQPAPGTSFNWRCQVVYSDPPTQGYS